MADFATCLAFCSLVYRHVTVHVDMHGTLAGADAVRDTHIGRRSPCPVVFGIRRHVPILWLVAQQVRARVDHGVSPLSYWIVSVPCTSRTAWVGGLWGMGSGCILYDSVVWSDTCLLGAACGQ